MHSEDEIKEGQLLLQGVSKCLCERCHCKVSEGKEEINGGS